MSGDAVIKLSEASPGSGAEQVMVTDERHLSLAGDLTQPNEILEWAASAVERLAIASSFQSSGLVILHMMRSLRPDVPVLFLNTGFHFEETLEFCRHVASIWGLNLVELAGEHGSPEVQAQLYGPALFRRDPNLCCSINKVRPLQDALEGFDGWISGLRRDQSPERSSSVSVVQSQMLPSGRSISKIHPLANWTKEDVSAYLREHSIPTHPLVEKGYASIGCWPCTRPIGTEENERAGRWDGIDKSECGIHTFGDPVQADATASDR